MDIFNTDDQNDAPNDAPNDASSTVSFSVGVDYILDHNFTFVNRDTQESIPLLNNNENEFAGKGCDVIHDASHSLNKPTPQPGNNISQQAWSRSKQVAKHLNLRGFLAARFWSVILFFLFFVG